MKYHMTFVVALADLYENGGAMSFDHPYWITGDAKDIASLGHDPIQSTINALRVGGFSESELSAFTADWVD
jgi:hypothetical protein